MHRRRTLVVALALSPLLARAHHEGGAQFTELKPEQPVESGDRIEVIEFFWYGCPHCYALEPVLEKWLPKLPADVAFRRVPAILNQRWAHDAGIFHALDALGVVDKLHRPLFDAIHRDRLRTDESKALGDWLRTRGVDPARFEQTLKSFGVQAKVRRAAQLSASYKIDGVPALAVHGRYLIGARGFEEMLGIADRLIAATRKTLAAKR